ncbi:MAG: phage/plasmid primase, P4 family [Kofleriaceae bacterium]|nr:phage/plasmid primase, P4 family [Kofleriaceae bacterium]
MIATLEQIMALANAPEVSAQEPSSSVPAQVSDEDAIALLVQRPTDTTNAEMFARQHGADLRWVSDWGTWVRYDGTRWIRMPSETMIKLAIDTVRSYYALANGLDHDRRDEATKVAKHALASETAARLHSMIDLARGLLVAPASEFDQDTYVLNVPNGSIDLRTCLLRPHRREDMHTLMSPIAFDATAPAPLWEAFLARVLPDVELRTFVQRYIGYCLTGDVGEQVFAFFHGRGANGKSTFLEVVQHVLGEYAKAGAPDLLLAKKGEAHPTEQADLKGARLVVCQEVEAGRQWAERNVKALTGGDTIKARFMRQDFFEFRPTHKFIVSANPRPKVRGQEEAIWRRIKLVPFEVTIPEAERDPGLPRKLKAEAPGILAWAVRGCLAWQHGGLGAPSAVDKATAAYRDEQDHLGRFVEERCELAAGAFVATSDLFTAYTSWCTRTGETAWLRDNFKEGLLEHAAWNLHERRTKAARGIEGIRLRPVGTTVVTPVTLVTPVTG